MSAVRLHQITLIEGSYYMETFTLDDLPPEIAQELVLSVYGDLEG